MSFYSSGGNLTKTRQRGSSFNMKLQFVFTAAVIVLAVSAGAAHGSNNGVRSSCPSYESSADYCHRVTVMNTTRSRCAFWSCMAQFCSEPFVQATQHKYCYQRHTAIRNGQLPHAALPADVVPRSTPLSVAPNVASPCGGGSGSQTAAEIRHWLLDTAMNVYYDRSTEHYTEGDQRWSGITGHVCPPSAPTYSDCSSTVTWIYWTLFGGGPDFLNNETWKAGYTGTLDQNGRSVPISTTDLAIGDLCFYYQPMHHVAIYVGGGMVVSHGMDPVGYYPYNYALVDFCRRYI